MAAVSDKANGQNEIAARVCVWASEPRKAQNLHAHTQSNSRCYSAQQKRTKD